MSPVKKVGEYKNATKIKSHKDTKGVVKLLDIF